MSDISFWKPVCQYFEVQAPLQTSEELEHLYVQRMNSPIEDLSSRLEMASAAISFLLAGHIGSGKTTELRKLEQTLKDYKVFWIDTATSLSQYNIGYAEIIVLIGLEIHSKVFQDEWGIEGNLLEGLEQSLMTVVREDKQITQEGFSVPEILQKWGLTLKGGLSKEITTKVDIRPNLENVIASVNDIIKAAENNLGRKLLMIVDGLDRHDQETALRMFSDELLTKLDCHIVYTIPISLRYSTNFSQPKERFTCLDLVNIPVFRCNPNGCPTSEADDNGRSLLTEVIQKRLQRLDDRYKDLFQPDALGLLCEKSGGVMRDLIRLCYEACILAKQNKLTIVDLPTSEAAIRKERGSRFNLHEYHFPRLAAIRQTGRLTSGVKSLTDREEMEICDEMLLNKLALGYRDASTGKPWFDVNPLIAEDVALWQTPLT
ncbi:MAG: KAP family NTPase [Scytolyngbya sp. HA4215-MV1]|jgi:energy-coupling factor transporter ATP-binding protein EcfA2|nr:KAP family NTPase [Scytolyngbya sp. HA4215-MV1]